MTMHSIYFLSYAMILSVSAVIMASAYYSRYKSEGAPVNYQLLMVISGAALAMWMGVAITEFAYYPEAPVA